jgi:hypothetical protein
MSQAQPTWYGDPLTTPDPHVHCTPRNAPDSALCGVEVALVANGTSSVNQVTCPACLVVLA